jgi:hypothetical protein
MTVDAPPQMQPWIRQTEARLSGLQTDNTNLQYAISRLPVRDKTVFTAGPAVSYPSGGGSYIIPANSTVQFINTTGLIEVTVSASMTANFYGSIGAGFYIDGATPVIQNYAPQFGVQFNDSTGTSGGSTAGMSYTIAIPVRPGLHTAGLFYFPNNTGTGTSQIYSSAIIVKGI